MPTKVDGILIVKIGYSKDLIKRKSDLCKTFGIDDMQLIFCIPIKNEAYELHIHTYLKEHYNHLYMATQKNEKSTFCVETYKFDIILIIAIMDIFRESMIKNEIHLEEVKLQIEEEQTKRLLKTEEEQTKRLFKTEEEQTKRAQIELEKEKVILEQLKVKFQIMQFEQKLSQSKST